MCKRPCVGCVIHMDNQDPDCKDRIGMGKKGVKNGNGF